MVFKQYNANPKNRKTTDCVIRAIATALNQDWDIVARHLYNLSVKMCATQTSTEVYTKYLKDYKTVPVKYEVMSGKRRYTVEDVCDWEGTYIIAVANHLTCVMDGKIYDTFDCSHKSAYKIWKIK